MDENRSRRARRKKRSAVKLILIVLCVILLCVFLYSGYKIISTIIGVLFIFLGNILPKTKPNSLVGVRMSWCIDSDKHWYITNRNCGIAMVLSGICTVIAGLIVRNGTYIIYMILSLILFLTVATIYSYVIIKKK